MTYQAKKKKKKNTSDVMIIGLIEKYDRMYK